MRRRLHERDWSRPTLVVKRCLAMAALFKKRTVEKPVGCVWGEQTQVTAHF